MKEISSQRRNMNKYKTKIEKNKNSYRDLQKSYDQMKQDIKEVQSRETTARRNYNRLMQRGGGDNNERMKILKAYLNRVNKRYDDILKKYKDSEKEKHKVSQYNDKVKQKIMKLELELSSKKHDAEVRKLELKK